MVITYMIRVRCVLRGPSYHMTIQPKGVRILYSKEIQEGLGGGGEEGGPLGPRSS